MSTFFARFSWLGFVAALASGAALAGTFPGSNLAFQTSAPQRCANIGDWYTTDGTGGGNNACGTAFGGTNTSNPAANRLHRFLVEITPAQLSSGPITLTVNDAESATGSATPCDEVDNGICGAPAGTGIGDPTRYRLYNSAGTEQAPIGGRVQASGTANGASANFTITTAGAYTLTSETGARPVLGTTPANQNDDDNAFTITVPNSGGLNGGGLGSFQGSFQQDTGATINANLYFLVGPSVAGLSLRNFDLDNNASSVSYTRPGGGNVAGTVSGGTVWNNGGNLDNGTDAVTVNSSSSAVGGDAGVWRYNLNGYTSNNQSIFEANDATNGRRLPAFDVPPQRAGLFTMSPNDVVQTTIGTPVVHPFTVTNQYFTTDIVNFTLSGTSANFTQQLLLDNEGACDGVDATLTALTDTDGDGNLDTGVLQPQLAINAATGALTNPAGSSACIVLRTTPQSGANTSDTTRVNGVSFMDRKVDAANNTTVFVDKTTLLPPRIVKSFSPSPIAANGTSTLTFTLTNVNSLPLTAVNFTDTLPTTPGQMQVAATPAASTTDCGTPTWAPVANALSVAFSNGSLAAGGTCTVQVNVTAPTAGTYANTSSAVSATAPVTLGAATTTGNTANANLEVVGVAPPSISKSFSTSPIQTGANATLTLTITNPNPSTVLNGVAVTDPFPSGLVIATPLALGGTCTQAPVNGTLTENDAADADTTVEAGDASLVLASATLAGGANCTITVVVSSASNATYVNTTGAVTSTNGGTGNTAGASLVVHARPTIAKAFNPDPINVNTASVLTITLTNPNSSAMTGAAFTDTYPTGIQNTATPSGATTCGGGTVTAATNGGTVALAGGTIPANGSCTVTVNVTSTTPGTRTNTIPAGGLTTTGGITNAAAATDTLTANAVAAPSLTKSFTPATIQNGSTSTLTLVVSNPNATAPLSGVAFTDTYPAPATGDGTLVNANPANPALSCTAGSTGNFTGGGNGGNTIGFSDGDLLPGGSCTVTVTVTTTSTATQSTFPNVTSAPTSANGGTGTAANATLTSRDVSPPVISKAFNLGHTLNGYTHQLTFTLTNPNTATALNNIRFTDAFPNPNGAADPGPMTLSNATVGGTCVGGNRVDLAGGALGAGDTGFQVSGNGLNLAANTSCTITVNITAQLGTDDTELYANSTGADNNIGTPGVTTDDAVSFNNGAGRIYGNVATASIRYSRPTVTKSFDDAFLVAGQSTVLRVNIVNPATDADIPDVDLIDTLPTAPGQMSIAAPLTTTNNCGGTLIENDAADADTTLEAADRSIVLNNGALGVGASCQFSVRVTATVTGDYTNTIPVGGLTTTGGSNPTAATATTTVFNPPTIAKVFSPATMGSGQTSTLTITLSNNSATRAATSASFTDNLPTNVTVSGGASTNCAGGTVNTTSTSVSLVGGTIPAGTAGTCAVTVNVTGTVTGTFDNIIAAGALTASTGTNAAAATAPLTILARPTVTKNFSPDPIGTGGTSTLTITLGNANATPLTITTVTDTFPTSPSQMVVATPLTTGGTCVGGTFSDNTGGALTAGDVGIRYTGGTIPTAGCTLTVNVTAPVAGTYTNTIPAGNVITTQAGSNTVPATDTLEIQGPSLTVLKASTVFSDPFNGQVNPKRIPGALVTYTIQVTNTGSGAVDNNTTVFVDPIPADVSLVLADFAGAGSGPVGFTQGADPSGLTYTFTSLASAADDIGFFSDAACTALITPTADANGVDSAVRCVRVNPKGVFLGDSIAGLPPSPGFSISFRARIK